MSDHFQFHRYIRPCRQVTQIRVIRDLYRTSTRAFRDRLHSYLFLILEQYQRHSEIPAVSENPAAHAQNFLAHAYWGKFLPEALNSLATSQRNSDLERSRLRMRGVWQGDSDQGLVWFEETREECEVELIDKY